MNDKRGKTFLVWLNLPRLLLHIICYLCSKNRGVIMQDLLARPLHCQLSAMQKGGKLLWPLCVSLVEEPEFCNVFYMRIGLMRVLLNVFLPKISSMRLSRNIGPGFCPIHSYSTIINGSAHIGKNCSILQNVTIGSGKGGVPTIGDNVSIGAGAIILGGITVGSHVRIGAGAIVVENVPDHSTVICDKARIIPRA